MKLLLSLCVLISYSGCLSGTFESSSDPNTSSTTTPQEDVGIVDTTTTEDMEQPSEECIPDDIFFSRSVNTMMTENCSGCHSATGVAGQSTFVLNFSGGYADYLERNLAVSEASAKRKNPDFDNRASLILKPLDIESHEGGKIFTEDSTEAKILEEFIQRVDTPTDCGDAEPDLPYLDGVAHIDGYHQLRRATLLLAGRLPSEDEIASVEANGMSDKIYDDIMTEDAFYAFLERGWNDILHTKGIEFPRIGIDSGTFPLRAWWDKLPNETDAEKAIYAKSRRGTSKGLRQGPLKLISYIIRENKPFTEVLTADYEMVNYYSAKAYLGTKPAGAVDLATANFSAADALPFKDRNDINEFLPVTFPGGGNTGIPSDENYYHAGLLSSSVLWQRYSTTATNLNRARARIFFKIFLDTNLLELAPRAGDANLIVNYTNPTKDFNQCNVCHSPMDPVAGLLQNFTAQGFRRPYNGTWNPSYTPGIGGKLIPASRIKDPERWLGEAATEDRRFPLAMVANGYFLLTGRERLDAPTDLNAVYFSEQQRAFEEQRKEILRIADLFEKSNYDFKVIIKEWLKSPLITADISEIELSAKRKVELGELGLVNMLSPEELSTKMKALFGRSWVNGKTQLLSDFSRSYDGRDYAEFYYLFDGIDSRELTARLKNPNGVNGAVMNLLAEEVACQNTAWDFSKPSVERLLFPGIEATTTNEQEIRETLVYLYERILGERLQIDDKEIDRAYTLWSSIQQDGEAQMEEEGYPKGLMLSCNSGAERTAINAAIPDDLTYTVRAWQSVMVYILSDYRFFFE